jgi:hypothetical protein
LRWTVHTVRHAVMREMQYTVMPNAKMLLLAVPVSQLFSQFQHTLADVHVYPKAR